MTRRRKRLRKKGAEVRLSRIRIASGFPGAARSQRASVVTEGLERHSERRLMACPNCIALSPHEAHDVVDLLENGLGQRARARGAKSQSSRSI